MQDNRIQGAIGGMSRAAQAEMGQVLGTTAGMSSVCAEQGNVCKSPEAVILATVEIRATRGFGDALYAALDGQRITRAGWNAKGQWVSSQRPDRNSKMGSPYLYLSNAQGSLVPWTPSQGDLFAHDWAVLPS